MKIQDYNLYVVVNIFGMATLDHSVYTDYAEALADAVYYGIIHNDRHTQYEAISLSFYQCALMGRWSLLEAYNLYCNE